MHTTILLTASILEQWLLEQSKNHKLIIHKVTPKEGWLEIHWTKEWISDN